MKKDIRLRLLEKIIIDKTGCWAWVGCRNKAGYGLISFNGNLYYVHRISAMIFLNFDIDSKLLVCHHCDNCPCVNPDHLFIGTHKDNMNDRDNKGRSVGFKGQKHSEETKRKLVAV